MGITYQIIRGIVFIVVLLIFLLLRLCVRSFFNSRKRRRILAIAAVIVAVSATLFSMMFPIENLFYSFKTPEEAIMYNYKVEPELIIMGQDSCYVSGRTEDNYSPYEVLSKTEDGWKLGKAYDLSICFTKVLSTEFHITVERFKDSEDYYIKVYDYTGIDRVITDKNGTAFVKWYQKGDDRSYLAYVHGFDQNYYIIVDGSEILME